MSYWSLGVMGFYYYSMRSKDYLQTGKRKNSNFKRYGKGIKCTFNQMFLTDISFTFGRLGRHQ